MGRGQRELGRRFLFHVWPCR